MPSRTALGKALKRTQRTCQCGRTFTISAKNGAKKFCSSTCCSYYRKKRAKERKAKGRQGKPITELKIIDGPCSFCTANGQDHTTGREICRACNEAKQRHAEVDAGNAAEDALLDLLYGPLDPKDEQKERRIGGGIAEKLRESRQFKPHPTGYPHEPAECDEFHDGVRRGRV